MTSMSLKASIKLSHKIRDNLKALKRGGETYNDVIHRLLKEAEG